MERSKQQIIDEIEKVNDEIDLIMHEFFSGLAKNERYKELTDKLRELLKQLDKIEGIK